MPVVPATAPPSATSAPSSPPRVPEVAPAPVAPLVPPAEATADLTHPRVLLTPTLPNGFALDGALEEWAGAHEGSGDWLALVFTEAGMIVAGELSTERATLRLTMPRPSLPPIGTAFGRAGVLPEYNCEFVWFVGTPLSPAESRACREVLRTDAAFRDAYEAEFSRSYVLDSFCARKPGSRATLPTINGAPGKCAADAGRLRIETTVSARELPRVSLVPTSSVRAVLTPSNLAPEEREPAENLSLPAPVVFASPKGLLGALSTMTEPPTGSYSERLAPALSYQPGRNDSLMAHGHRYIGLNPGSLSWIDTDPTRLVATKVVLPATGTRLGRTELRVLPPEISLLAWLVDGIPKQFFPYEGIVRVLVRDGELQVLQALEGMDDASLRPQVTWKFLRVSSDGEVLPGEYEQEVTYSTLSLGVADRAFHDATFSRIGGYLASGKWHEPDAAKRVSWRYDPKLRLYVQVVD